MNKLETLVSVIGSSSGSLIYAYEKPQNKDECIVWKLISSVPIRGVNSTICEQTRVQLDCYSATLGNSRLLADNLKVLLDMKTDNFIVSYLDSDMTVKDIESGLYRTILDFIII
jgi:hypothetical protein